MDIYKFAAQNQVRFPSNRGLLVVEQLFALPLKSGSGFDLDSVAKTINNELKSVSEESFVEDPSSNPQKRALEVALEVVKDVIVTKQEEGRLARERLQKAEQRRKILDAMAARKDAKITEASMEELEKQLAALDA